MKKNVLIIAGSPRREGNSDLLCEAFAQGAREANHSVEMVTLRSLHIAPCQACYGCRASHVCVQKDDMETLMSRMLACDVIVLATPVYFYSMSAQMKAMIDRTLPVYAQMRGKALYFIATAAASRKAMERTMDALQGFADCLPQAVVRARICGEGVYQKGEVRATEAMAQALAAGRDC